MARLSILVITRNEEKNIKDCLESVSFADEVIVVDSYSNDRTAVLAEEKGVKVFLHQFKNFSDQKNFALSRAASDWVFYLDADERITPELAKEILKKIHSPKEENSAFKIKRKNFYLGENPWPHIEKLERLFKKDSLSGWRGQLHESPIFKGSLGQLDGFLIHYAHASLSEMVKKTIVWSEIEARLRFKTKHPKMTWWRFPKIMLMTFADYYFKQGGWKIGTVGLIESLYQSFSIFITYARLWEMQKENEG
jgi:glycosyltransferase involved in cell wall biosynthesis